MRQNYRILLVLCVYLNIHRVTGNVDLQCGLLSVNNKTLSLGSEMALTFLKTGQSTGIFFEFKNRTEIKFTEIGVYDKQYQLSKYGQNYILKKPATTRRNTGQYRVRCSDGSYTETILVQIVILPPAQPRFLQTVDLPECPGCIPVHLSRSKTLTCITNRIKGAGEIVISMATATKRLPAELTITDLYYRIDYSFIPTADDLQETFTCSVKNEALVYPIQTSSKLYQTVDPTTSIAVQDVILENVPTTVTCIGTGLPSPAVSVQHQNTNITEPVVTGVNGQVTLTPQIRFGRSENNGTIKCCASSPVSTHCSTNPLKISFASHNITLTELERTDGRTGEAQVNLRCETTESLPASNITWFGLKNMWRKQGDLRRIAGPSYNGMVVVQDIQVNVTKDKNGRKIRCEATNNMFPAVSLEAEYTINVTYAPVVRVADVNVTVTEGEDVTVICQVESNPPSKVQWFGSSGDSLLTDTNRRTSDVPLLIRGVQKGDSGVYRCAANNGIGGTRDAATAITVTEAAASFSDEESGKGSNSGVIAAIFVVIAVIALIIVIALCVVRKKQQQRPVNAQDPLVKDEFRIGNEDSNMATAPPGSPSDDVMASPSTGAVDDIAVYSQPIPRSQRTKPSNQKTSSGTGELMYADLDLVTSTRAAAPPDEERECTEYSTIDFAQSTDTQHITQ